MTKIILGNSVIYQGDCMKVLMQMPDESVDAIITDPPYSSGGTWNNVRQQNTGSKYTNATTWTSGGLLKTFKNFVGDNKDQRSYKFWLSLWLTEAYRVLKTGEPICIFTDWRQYPTLSDVLQSAGFVWRGCYVWNKKNSRPVKGRFKQQTEFVLWGSKGDMKQERGVAYLPGISHVSISKGRRYHQTSKPVELMKEVVEIVRPGGTILDPFMGAGSTGVAALEMGRKFIGVEYVREYFDTARERLSLKKAS